jgi:hypothetical protein
MSSRAHAFIVDVAERHGRPLGGGRVEIPLTQAELARLHGRSPGTVSYYLRCAGSVVVARRHASLVVDLSSLVAPDPDDHHEVPGDAGSSPPRRLRVAPESPPKSPAGSSPTASVPSALSGHQVIEIVSTLVTCLTEVSTALAGLGEQLLAALHHAEAADVPATTANESAKSAKPSTESANESATSANVAGGFSLPFRKEESLPSFPHREDRERIREIRETETPSSRYGSSPVASGADLLPYELVDQLVAPLRALARRSARPDHLDDNGRAVLAKLSEAQLRQGVLHVQREAAADAGVHKPLGLLVHRALSGQTDFFAGPAPSPPPPVVLIEEPDGHGEVDEEAVTAVAELEARTDHDQELAVLDAEVHSWLASHGGTEVMQRLLLRRDLRGLRQAAWRRLQTPFTPQGDSVAL